MSSARHVRRLRLRAPDAASARRVAIKLEDALRTASLPDGGGRLLFVRRLSLGSIDPRAPPASLALKLEQAFARGELACVHGATPQAAQVSAVWFRDALEMHRECARRVLHGPPCQEWFWPHALPAVRAQTGGLGVLRELALSLAALPEAAAALPAWVAAVDDLGGSGALRAVLDARDARILRRACGLSAQTDPAIPNGWGGGASGTALATGAASDAAGTPADEADAPLRDIEVATVLGMLRQRARGGRSHEAGAARDIAGGASHRRWQGQPPDATVVADVDCPLATRAGGLAFLLNVLAQLGYGTWLDRQPEWRTCDVAHRVLARVLAQLHIGPDDPAWSLIEGARGAATMPAPTRFEAPTGWRAELGFEASLRESAARSLQDRVVQAWTIALRRWLRHFPRIALADLVLRPATMAITPTHLSVGFDPGLVDLRVRRAGLDLDPGWLGWFGRVVSFHYRRIGS